MRVSFHGSTHSGCLRENNEDAYLIDPSRRLAAVADGLGGLPDGERASKLAIQTLAEEAALAINGEAPDFQRLFGRINAAVFAEGSRAFAETGIGTTLTSACIHQGRLFIGHVGDSGAYLWRQGNLHCLTEEHTMAALYGGSHSNRLESGLPEYYFHTLTRCIGPSAELEAALYDLALEAGDRLLLCTDGLTKVLSHRQLEACIGRVKTARSAVELLLEQTLEGGAPDNVAVVAMFVEEGEPVAQANGTG